MALCPALKGSNMVKRFAIICLILTAALAGLFALGSSALRMHARSLQMERQGQFVSVAEQIRLDVKRKLDDFIQTEQKRPYTDYLPQYVPETMNAAVALVKSPLADSMTNGMAYGYFQIDPDGKIVLPYTSKQKDVATVPYVNLLEGDLITALGGKKFLQTQRVQFDLDRTDLGDNTLSSYLAGRRGGESISQRSDDDRSLRAVQAPAVQTQQSFDKSKEDVQTAQASTQQSQKAMPQAGSSRARYNIGSFEQSGQQVQVLKQERQTADLNVQNISQSPKSDTLSESAAAEEAKPVMTKANKPVVNAETNRKVAETVAEKQQKGMALPAMSGMGGLDGPERPKSEPTVQIRIEPFVSILVPYSNGTNGVFSGQVFLLRHVQIEKTHLIQGFQLSQTELLNQVKDSVNRFLRPDMGFEISRDERPGAAYTAILDFGFGELGLHLLEIQSDWVARRIGLLSNWFYGITLVVVLAVTLAMVSLWRSLSEQVRLSKKKDDFISAVSHELRTPLTSIRMYSEMLEKDWVPTEAKRKEYYSGMRQETERLSRLIENVLDFSRIQRGKKHFQFVMGDLNEILSQAAHLMEPCVKKAGFELATQYAPIESFAFDRDAITQIVINLLDNACKYARPSLDNRITLRTKRQDGFVLIEVEDHGPGIPRREHARIFDAFYRCADESTRQTTGTGLGLALVKRFAEAHRGFVQLAPANPTGCIFRVAFSLSEPPNA
jgi:signal transduction histidine kinase